MVLDDRITLRCEKEFKTNVEKLAKADGRKMSNYILNILKPIIEERILELNKED